MKIKLTLLIVLVVGLACSSGEDTTPTQEGTIDSETGTEPIEKYVYYGIDIDLDIIKPTIAKYKRDHLLKALIYSDVHVVVNGKEYFFTLDEFIKRIEN